MTTSKSKAAGAASVAGGEAGNAGSTDLAVAGALKSSHSHGGGDAPLATDAVAAAAPDAGLAGDTPDSLASSGTDGLPAAATTDRAVDVGDQAGATLQVTDAVVVMRRAVVIFSMGGRQIGDLVESTSQIIEGLAKSGDVDPHPSAVRAAEGRGAPVHRIEE